MSSEMRESKFTNEDLETISRTWNSNKYTEHTAMLLASELLRARALLALTEAGADHGAADHGVDLATKESLVPCDCGCGRSCCAFCGTDLGFVTHPQDASGDAEDAEWLDRLATICDSVADDIGWIRLADGREFGSRQLYMTVLRLRAHQ